MRSACAAWLVTALALAVGAPAGADTLFLETFDGYTSFPAYDPIGDRVNPGVPLQSEGADQEWFGARFAYPTSACDPNTTIDCDLAVQQFGNLTNHKNPVGRFEDEAGLLFRVDTTDYQDITLDELQAALMEAGLTVSRTSLHRFFVRHGMTRKKRPGTPSSRTAPTS